jgi:adenylosuccinate lyase
VPRASAAAAVALALGVELVGGLQVDAARMRENVDAQCGYVFAEPVVLALAPSVGHRRAHELVRDVSLRGRERGLTLLEALAAEPAVTEHLPVDRLEALLRAEPALDEQIDRVLRPEP